MIYKKGVTIKKVAIPAVVIMSGSQIIQALAMSAEIDISDELSYQIITVLYSLSVGVVNWFKHRKQG